MQRQNFWHLKIRMSMQIHMSHFHFQTLGSLLEMKIIKASNRMITKNNLAPSAKLWAL